MRPFPRGVGFEPEWADKVMGDQGPWIRYVATAWQAAATEAPDVPVPTRPARDAEHDEHIAYWAPLLHLLVYGLGWPRPDLGLANWRDRRWPLENPILRVVHRWWGEDGVLDFLAWLAMNGGIAFKTEQQFDPYSMAHPPQANPFRDTPELAERRRSSGWQASFGGGTDALHLTHHLGAPLVLRVLMTRRSSTVAGSRPMTKTEIPRFHIVNDRYEVGTSTSGTTSSDSAPTVGRFAPRSSFARSAGWASSASHKNTGLWFPRQGIGAHVGPGLNARRTTLHRIGSIRDVRLEGAAAPATQLRRRTVMTSPENSPIVP